CCSLARGRLPKGLVTGAAVNRKKKISADNERHRDAAKGRNIDKKKHVSGMNTENVQYRDKKRGVCTLT
ncbi:hypothetical protein L9F63_003540, partial [Diploptera punctata]